MGIDVEKDTIPDIRILDPNPGKSAVLKYKYNQKQITKEEIEQFVDDFVNGRVAPFMKVESNPITRYEKIIPLNSENFYSTVMDKSKDVFVFFYTENCKLCEDFWQVYIEAAKFFEQTPDLVFASINMKDNELDDKTDIYYYPTIKYYPTNSKTRPYDYDKNMDFEDVKRFVKRAATVELISPPEYAVKNEEKQ